jgi:hypothetical protein
MHFICLVLHLKHTNIIFVKTFYNIQVFGRKKKATFILLLNNIVVVFARPSRSSTGRCARLLHEIEAEASVGGVCGVGLSLELVGVNGENERLDEACNVGIEPTSYDAHTNYLLLLLLL